MNDFWVLNLFFKCFLLLKFWASGFCRHTLYVIVCVCVDDIYVHSAYTHYTHLKTHTHTPLMMISGRGGEAVSLYNTRSVGRDEIVGRQRLSYARNAYLLLYAARPSRRAEGGNNAAKITVLQSKVGFRSKGCVCGTWMYVLFSSRKMSFIYILFSKKTLLKTNLTAAKVVRSDICSELSKQHLRVRHTNHYPLDILSFKKTNSLSPKKNLLFIYFIVLGYGLQIDCKLNNEQSTQIYTLTI